MLDAYAEVVLPFLHHVVKDGMDVAGPHITAAEPSRTVVDLRDALNAIQAILAGGRIAKGGLNFPRQVIAGRGKRVVHPFQDGKRLAVF